MWWDGREFGRGMIDEMSKVEYCNNADRWVGRV